jgi:uncharacterized membrane protein YheB (UPF0754 family)
MDIVRFVLLVIIGGFIGWLTNKVAIKMLFRPINPHKFLGIKIQGVFPRRKDQIAISLANIIEQELLSKEVIMNQLMSKEKIDEIKIKMKKMIVEKLSQSIPSVLAMFVGGDLKGFVEKYVAKHGDEMFDEMLSEFQKTGLDNLDIQKLVKERIDELDFVEFEKIMVGLMSKELRFVEIVGLFLGAFIGAIQYLITVFV